MLRRMMTGTLLWCAVLFTFNPAWAGTPQTIDSPAPTGETTPTQVLLAQADAENKRASSKKAREAAMRALAEEHPGTTPETSAQGDDLDPIVNRPPPPSANSGSLVRMAHHGYLRIRNDLFYNLDLNTRGTSPIPSPLTSGERAPDAQFGSASTDGDTLTSSNLRMRYAPVFHIKEHLKVHLTMDFFDNLVFGSTPSGLAGSTPAEPLPGLSHTSESPSLKTTGQESILLREAYGEIEWAVGILRAGRMGNNWGMGMLLSDGGSYDARRVEIEPEGQAWNCLDCEHGDFIDRLEIEVRDPVTDFFYVRASWDIPSSGLSSYNSASGSGSTQAFDLDTADDVTQFTLSIFDTPLSPEEIARRKRDLQEQLTVFDWGATLLYRYQDFGLNRNTTPNDYTGINTAADIDGIQVIPQELSLLTTDAWFRTIITFGAQEYLRIEGEAAAVLGSLYTQTVIAQDNSLFERDILQLGAALEVEMHMKNLSIGTNGGFASPDSDYGFGYKDVDKLNQPNPQTGQFTTKLSGFRFNQNYMVDLIMFRELVGGITNAIYLDPYIAYRFGDIANSREQANIGVRFDLISAIAIDKKATPGNGSWYGIESDFKFFYEEPNDYRFELATGLFLPGNVWDRVPGDATQMPSLKGVYELTQDQLESGLSPDIAWTLQGNFWWMF